MFTAEYSMDIKSNDFDKVWSILADFNGLPLINNTMTSRIENGLSVHEVGCIRFLSLPNDGFVREELVEFNNENHTFSYTIVEGTIPVKGYRAKVTLKNVDTETVNVHWIARFDVADSAIDGESLATNISQGVFKICLEGLQACL